jgi:error-prone DNA polymerase
VPDRVPPSRRSRIVSGAGSLADGSRTGRGQSGYVELCCRTNYSFLEAASHPDELVARAFELGQSSVAITDVNSLAGVVRAHVAARELEQSPPWRIICGARLRFQDAPPVVVWVADRESYSVLCRLLTLGRRRADKGECRLWWDDLAGASGNLLAGVLLHRLLPVGAVGGWGRESADEFLERFAATFGDRGYALGGLFRGRDDAGSWRRMTASAANAGLPLIATSDVLYHHARRQPLADVLAAIRHRCPLDRLGSRRQTNAERALKGFGEMVELVGGDVRAVQRSLEVVRRCNFSLDELKYEYPEELSPEGSTTGEHLRRLTFEGAATRYPSGVPAKVRALVDHELRLIAELEYEPYFLTVWDLVRFARSQGILCQGRGSAANSAVCYCLGITSVDPERIDVLFERFVSRERDEAPDIDVDFEHERREEVLQYLYGKYGRDRAGMTGVVITYRPRSALRDVGKALGLSLDRVDRLSRMVDGVHDDDRFAGRIREAGLDPGSRLGGQLMTLVREILGFPRHLSQHVGGMVITRGLLSDLVPIENAAMPGRTVIQWDKNDLDALGILKVDCLSLGMLTAIHRCLAMISGEVGEVGGVAIGDAMAEVPAEDPAVYEMISRADTMGVFQIESRAQMSMLPRLQPRCFYDLVIEVAIVRPGPIQGDMVHPYLRRRAGREDVSYPNEAIRGVLEKTLGVPIFQEQAMRLAVVAAGFTPGQADQLRRAMGAWRRPGVIDKFQKQLVEGMTGRGYDELFAERVFRQIRGFGEYGFPESHAASFALLVYVSAWLKRYHPAAFCASLLNCQPMGFYAPSQLVTDVRKHGVEVRQVDINHSDWDCTIESDGVLGDGDSVALRLGLRMVRGLSESVARRVVCERARGEFESVWDVSGRVGLGEGEMSRLARADVFGSLEMSRRGALWDALADRSDQPLWNDEIGEAAVELPERGEAEEVVADYRSQGLSLRGHPFQSVRPRVSRLGAVTAGDLRELRHGTSLAIAGLVLLRQRPSSARGVTFVTLEDETGMANLIIKPAVWERYHRVANSARAMLAFGTLQNQQGVVHLLVSRLVDLSEALGEVKLPSRDFR